jgi:phosphoribosylamine-glycine ligase
MFDFGILGNNARNLHYIKKFNPRKAIRLADNKQKTKLFLRERGISSAETFAIIRNRKELHDFDFSTIPQPEFVIKPNHGSKGRGITIVHTLPNQHSLNFKIKEQIFTEPELKYQLTDILDGEYSMTYNDSILIEEKLLP